MAVPPMVANVRLKYNSYHEFPLLGGVVAGADVPNTSGTALFVNGGRLW